MPSATNDAIRVHGLTKRFPRNERLMGLLPAAGLGPPAVDGVHLTVRKGELFGLLGPNGAGKTTLVKMLATLVLPTSGSARVCGYDLADEAAIKSVVGLVTTDERSFFWRLTGRQNLAFFGTLHGLPDLEDRIGETLALVGMEPPADRPFREYSTGMRQRLAIARALLYQPQVLFLDEPTRGLDPPAIRALHTLIRRELTASRGLTVLMTTHWLQEAESLCDRLAILHRGRVRGIGTLAELRGLIAEGGRYRLEFSGVGANGVAWPVRVETLPDGSVQLDEEESQVDLALRALRAAGGRVESLQRAAVPLEAVFDKLIEEEPSETGRARHPGGADVGPAPETPPPVPPDGSIRRPGFWQVAGAFLRRDWLSERSYRLAFLLSFGGIFFSAAVFYFVAQLVDTAAAPYLAPYGGSYFAFVLVGIALQRYFSVGLTGFASAFRQAQTTGTLEAMLATPARLWQLVVASSLWSYGIVTLQVLLYLLVGALFLGVQINADPAAVAATAVLGVAAFASLGVLSASFVMVIKRGDPISWAVGAVSTFFGGVYFPVEVLPDWLEPLSAVLPVTYGLRALRLSLLQGAGIAQIAGDLAALGVFVLVLLPLGLWAFRAAVRRARVDGSLTHY